MNLKDRLRAGTATEYMQKEAADEIEHKQEMINALCRLRDEQKTEIERLEAELAFYEPKCSKCGNHLGLLAESTCPTCRDRAEIERLKGQVKSAREALAYAELEEK